MNEILNLNPNTIVIRGRLRPIDREKLGEITDSVRSIGIKTPITIRVDRGEPVLVAGLHRLEAARQLGIQVPCIKEEGDEIEAEMWEIAENLHRAELSALDHADHVARWIDLSKQRHPKPAQLEPVSGGRGNTGGINAAARELHIDRNEAQRAVKVSSLTPEAKAAARATGLADNRSVLLQAARAPAAQQEATIREEAEKRSQRQYVVHKPTGPGVPLEERASDLQLKFWEAGRDLIGRHLASEFPIEDPGCVIEILEALIREVQNGDLTGAGYRA